MAIINMNQLFDKLQEYIDQKIESTGHGIEDIFIEYGLKEVAGALPQIVSVANSIVEVRLVAHNIGDVITCGDNMAYIKAAPQAATDAIEASQIAVDARDYSYRWSSNPEDQLINDGINPTGYSAYHWAKKAEDVYVDPSLYYMRNGSQPLTDNFQANNYQLKFVQNGTDGTDAVNVRQIYLQNEFINISTGTPDAAKPIILDANGMIDASMVPMQSGWINQGDFTPTGGQEYPDTTGLPSGSFWSVIGVDDVNGYTFTSGDLNTKTVYNSNLMIWSGGIWSIRVSDLNPLEFYKLNGTQAITANFAGGGFKLTNIADGVQLNDGATFGQVSDMVDNIDKGDIGLEYAIVSDVTVPGVGTAIGNIVAMTQPEYDNITPNDNTLYIITGA